MCDRDRITCANPDCQTFEWINPDPSLCNSLRSILSNSTLQHLIIKKLRRCIDNTVGLRQFVLKGDLDRFLLDTDVSIATLQSPGGASVALVGSALDLHIVILASVLLFF